jgi:hypothetical protein
MMHEAHDGDELKRAMCSYRALEVDEVLFDIPTDAADVLLPLLDRLADWSGLAESGSSQKTPPGVTTRK